MSMPTARLRMFAGPNGSGKSTIRSLLRPELLGLYINPDEIEATARRHGSIDLAAFDIAADQDEVQAFFGQSR